MVVSQRKLNNESVVNNDDAFDDEFAVAVGGNDQDVFVRDRFFEKKRRRREKIFA